MTKNSPLSLKKKKSNPNIDLRMWTKLTLKQKDSFLKSSIFQENNIKLESSQPSPLVRLLKFTEAAENSFCDRSSC